MRRIAGIVATLTALTSSLLPVYALAQSGQQDQLHATIWAALLSDPRTADIPPVQMQALVNSLADQAVVQGIKPEEIKWNPSVYVPAGVENTFGIEEKCDGVFSSLCPFSDAFGFVGTDIMIPAILFVTSALLLLIIRRIIVHHKKDLLAEVRPAK